MVNAMKLPSASPRRPRGTAGLSARPALDQAAELGERRMRANGDKRLLPFSAFRVLLGSFVSKEMKDQTLPRAMRVSLFAVCLIPLAVKFFENCGFPKLEELFRRIAFIWKQIN